MRDHDREFQDNTERKYAYTFDDVVRSYLMRTLSPYFPSTGKALEIGCFDGGSTLRLAEYFHDLTVLEASGELIATAKNRLPMGIEFVHGTIEGTTFDSVFDAIFLVHTLEHLDDPVACLSRVRNWLSAAGRLYLVVPNAQAASRQIAVRMGLIETNHSVTAGERQHGHRCTYSLDTLENDARKSGLRTEVRGGVMFKPFANFQFDAMIEHGIIDQSYLEGCYAMGMQYPELAASIYLVCRRD